jgi:hypothetical protein
VKKVYSKTLRLAPVLRELVIQGKTLEEAAALAGCSRGAASRIKKFDEEVSGKTWDSLQLEAASGKASPITLAKAFRDSLLHRYPGHEASFDVVARHAEALRNAQAVVSALLEEFQDPELALRGIEAFAEYLQEPRRLVASEDPAAEAGHLRWFRRRLRSFRDHLAARNL